MIQNQQSQVTVPVSKLERFASRARKELRLPPESFSVALVTSSKISRWNRAYRGKRGPTDVLSFPADSKAPRRRVARGEDTYLGDIAISPQVARRNAVRAGHSSYQELCILLLHGILHLIGYDHERDNGQMERKEYGYIRDERREGRH